MKKIALLFCVALSSLMLQAQEEIMKVCKADGTVVTFKVAEVDSVVFGVEEEVVLNNQYEIYNKVHDILQVIEEDAVDGFYSYQFFEEGEQPTLTLRIPSALLGKTVDLGESSEVQIYSGELLLDAPVSGSLKISKDKFQKNVTVAVEAVWEQTELRVQYSGIFTKNYVATNLMAMTTEEAGQDTEKILTVFKQTEATGGSTAFLFGASDTTNPEDLTQTDYAIYISLSASKLNAGTIDLTTDANSYQLKVYDYVSGNIVSAGENVVGILTTYADPSGDENKICLKLHATLENGTVLVVDYFGSTTVADLELAKPVVASTNCYTLTNTDGLVETKADIVQLKVKEDGDFTYFYFMKNDTDRETDTWNTPNLAIKTSLINAGELDVVDAEAFTWKFNFFGMALSSTDNEWMNIATNGVIKVDFDGENYTIDFTITDSYYTPWSQGTPSGTMREMKLHYVGAGTAM